MNRTLNAVSTSLATLLVLVAASGCKVSACPDAAAVNGGKSTTKDNCIQLEPTVEYDGTPRTASTAWSTGTAVSIRNRNGSLVVTSDSTSATDVQVSGVPFTRDGTSDADRANATAHINAMAAPSVTTGPTGVVIDGPGGGFDGYKLTVRLPAAFDGVLGATIDNGELTYSGTPTTIGNSLHSGNGDVTASFGAGAKLTATAKTDLGTVIFEGAWISPSVETDQRSGSAMLGDGSAAIGCTTGNGDVVLKAP